MLSEASSYLGPVSFSESGEDVWHSILKAPAPLQGSESDKNHGHVSGLCLCFSFRSFHLEAGPLQHFGCVGFCSP